MAICKYCNQEIRWIQSGGRWIPLESEHDERHYCSKRFDVGDIIKFAIKVENEEFAVLGTIVLIVKPGFYEVNNLRLIKVPSKVMESWLEDRRRWQQILSEKNIVNASVDDMQNLIE